MTSFHFTNIYGMLRLSGKCSLGRLLGVLFFSTGSMLVHAAETKQANIIDGLTYADTCLYMLESTRQLEQPDCDTLFEWHKQKFPHLPAPENLENTARVKFERNFKLYNSTLRSVRKILDSEVSGQ